MTAENQLWLNEVMEKIKQKLSKTVPELKSTIPFTTKDGKYDDKFAEDSANSNGIYWWTNGFYPGILWRLYLETKDDMYKKYAEECEEHLDKALFGFEGLHHDVGFMWLLSSVANYRITGSEKSKQRGMLAASILASRYNIKGGFIRAWNWDKIGWSIIDSMMNIPILHWASGIVDDKRFSAIAEAHADKVIKHFIRDDGSVKHIVSFDPNTGEEIENLGGQGYEVDSSWSRGQSWALYGFILSYIHTKKQEYLDTAKRVAHYFISNIQDDFIPDCDFRAPKEPVIKDTSAGACAACGLIEISKHVGEHEKDLYLNNAINILKALDKNCADYSAENQQLLNMGTGAYHDIPSRHMSLIYGDYYYIEAICKLTGNDMLLW